MDGQVLSKPGYGKNIATMPPSSGDMSAKTQEWAQELQPSTMNHHQTSALVRNKLFKSVSGSGGDLQANGSHEHPSIALSPVLNQMHHAQMRTPTFPFTNELLAGELSSAQKQQQQQLQKQTQGVSLSPKSSEQPNIHAKTRTHHQTGEFFLKRLL